MKAITLILCIPLVGCMSDVDADHQSTVESAATFESAPNANGHAATISRTGEIDRSSNNPFFRVRFNGRTCGTCHDTTAGWGVTPQLAQSKFATNPSNV